MHGCAAKSTFAGRKAIKVGVYMAKCNVSYLSGCMAVQPNELLHCVVYEKEFKNGCILKNLNISEITSLYGCAAKSTFGAFLF